MWEGIEESDLNLKILSYVNGFMNEANNLNDIVKQVNAIYYYGSHSRFF